jgi:hypothetical protein
MGTAGFWMSAAALACLRVRLAHLFEQAADLDPDAGMLAESCRAAEEAVMNIRWVQGLAEDLPSTARVTAASSPPSEERNLDLQGNRPRRHQPGRRPRRPF